MFKIVFLGMAHRYLKPQPPLYWLPNRKTLLYTVANRTLWFEPIDRKLEGKNEQEHVGWEAVFKADRSVLALIPGDTGLKKNLNASKPSN